MKTVGIIGGFGPEATAQFYMGLTAKTRTNILVRHVFVPRKLEHDALISGNNLDAFKPLLVSAAMELEKNGADIIVLPCNTLHIHEDAIRSALGIPFISIIEETARFLHKQNISKIGFLGTRVTIRENLFKKRANGTTFITIPSSVQRRIDFGLDQFVGEQKDKNLKSALHESFRFFRNKNVQDVLLACTDFHGLCPNGVRIHDTLDILVRATIDMI